MAENKKYYWLKLKEDFFRDKRIKKLRRIAGGDTYTVIYLKMQLLSIKTNGMLIYEGIEDNFAEELALELDEDIENVKVTLAFMHSNGMIEETEPDKFIMTETIKCIGSESASAERVRKYRAKKAQKMLQCNAQVTDGNTEIEKEKDLEIDIEIEKETEIEEEQEQEKTKGKAKRFTKPTLAEVQAYCTERNNNVDAEHFYDYYEANGWKVGKNSMKDWKASVRTWERNGYSDNNNKTAPTQKPSAYNSGNVFLDMLND